MLMRYVSSRHIRLLARQIACASSVGYLYTYISAWASALLVLNTMGIAKASYFAERVMITDSHAESYAIP